MKQIKILFAFIFASVLCVSCDDAEPELIPKLNVSSESLMLDDTKSVETLTILNAGTGELIWNLTNVPEYITCTPNSGTTETLIDIKVEADLSYDAANYVSAIKVVSNAGKADVILKFNHAQDEDTDIDYDEYDPATYPLSDITSLYEDAFLDNGTLWETGKVYLNDTLYFTSSVVDGSYVMNNQSDMYFFSTINLDKIFNDDDLTDLLDFQIDVDINVTNQGDLYHGGISWNTGGGSNVYKYFAIGNDYSYFYGYNNNGKFNYTSYPVSGLDVSASDKSIKLTARKCGLNYYFFIDEVYVGVTHPVEDDGKNVKIGFINYNNLAVFNNYRFTQIHKYIE